MEPSRVGRSQGENLVSYQFAGPRISRFAAMVVAPEQCVAARPALVHTSGKNEEWSKMRDGELVRRNVVVEID